MPPPPASAPAGSFLGTMFVAGQRLDIWKQNMDNSTIVDRGVGCGEAGMAGVNNRYWTFGRADPSVAQHSPACAGSLDQRRPRC